MTTIIDIPAACGEPANSPTLQYRGRLAAAVRTVLDRLRESIDYDEIAPEHMRSYLSLGFCVDCDSVRVLARNGNCLHCTSASTMHRYPNVNERRKADGKEQESAAPDAPDEEGQETLLG